MYNKNDFKSIDLFDEPNMDLKMQLRDIIVDRFYEGGGRENFTIYNCCVCKNESKIYYCYIYYEYSGDTYYVEIDFNKDIIDEVRNHELKEIIFNCDNK